jgi:AbrB family looped-hinge helix DNA binding protein
LRFTEKASIHASTYRPGIDPLTAGANTMETVKVSPKFQVVIPKKVREALKLKPGAQLHVYVLDDVIRLQRPRSIKELRGIAKGMKWKDDYQDHSERF